MKLLGKITAAAMLMAIVPTQAMSFQDADKESMASHAQVEQSKVVKALLAKAMENNDALLYMAAGKMFDGLGELTLIKKGSLDKADKDLGHDDFWSAGAAFSMAAKIAGANSEMGKQASALASAAVKDTGAEGCYGYRHRHYVWWYDRYGYYHERTVAIHNC